MLYCDIDHEELFSICETLKGDFLITYDNADEVKALAEKHGFQYCLTPMNNTHHATMQELVIGKDISWTKMPSAVLRSRMEWMAGEPSGQEPSRQAQR